MHCSCVDAFRHRAAAIIADPTPVSHGKLSLTLTRPARHAKASERMPREEGHPPRIVPDIDMRP
jgi:hypothetical protein